MKVKHQIEVEQTLPAEPGIQHPRLTAGERANPIEDCGDPWALEGLLKVLSHPDLECYWPLEEWGLGNWDPAQFDAENSKRILARRAGCGINREAQLIQIPKPKLNSLNP